MLSVTLIASCTEVSEEELTGDVEETTPEVDEEEKDDEEEDNEPTVEPQEEEDDEEPSISGLTNIDPNTFVPKFIAPTAPFIIIEGETNYEISYSGDSVEELQTLLDDQKALVGDNMVIVHLNSKVTVTSTSGPLLLSDKTILSFDTSDACIVADDTASSGSINALIQITDAQYVGIMTGTSNTASKILNGNSIAKYGIYSSGSGKINIDNLTIENFTNCGIYLSGTSNTEYNQAASVTRCTIRGCSESGIWATNAARYVVSDNTLSYNGYGVYMVSMSATIHNNELENNSSAAISLDVPSGQSSTSYPYGVVTRNTIKNNPVGILLNSETRGILVTENTVNGNTTGISMGGSYNRIFDNTMNNVVEISNTGSTNIIMHNTDLDIGDITGTMGQYFNPPTSDDRHSKTIISSRERADLTITNSGTEAMSLDLVQAELDAFISQNSGKYVVLWLTGDFVADGVHTGLKIVDYVSVVFDGTMYPEGDEMDYEADTTNHYVKGTSDGGTQMVLFSGTNFNSFSGGTIDCKHMPSWGLYAPTDNVLLIDDVAIKGAYANNIGVLYHSGVSRPAFIHDCDFDGYDGLTNRGVWVHVCEYIYCIGNTSTGHLADFVDLDAGGHKNKVLFNFAEYEGRCAVFIEEGVDNNFVMGNLFLGGDTGNGIGMYSSASVGNEYCENNLLLFNTMTYLYGMNIRYGYSNFSFNNRVTDVGLYGVYLNAVQNYSSQIRFGDGGKFADAESNYFFTLPY